ncbi:MAG TPA: hypothetical protein EYO73_09775, partial [Sulfurimonas sp.]|nr:hypothetical protein [Sulfurimonas sp.]
DHYGNGSIRATTRESIQFHGIAKGNLKDHIQKINNVLLSTMGACGDVVRNVMAPPAPLKDSRYEKIIEDALTLSHHFYPKTNAYHEIWHDGEEVTRSEFEPLYGKSYLPRKFKMAIALPEDNSVDVLTHDCAIVALLMSVNPKAQLIHVGRRGYQKKIRPDLHPSVIKKAKEGKTVARLKSGDPMIFGKASEECHELIKANISFEIIPGITSALGAASSCAIPLTEKGSSSEVLFLNGHKLFGAKGHIYSHFEGTLIFYMGKKNLPQHCQRIIDLGKDPKTPAIFIEGATTIEQKVIYGDLKTLPHKVRENAGDAPALFMVGKVLKNYPTLKEKGPFLKSLSQKRILLLRSKPGSPKLSNAIRDLGAEVFEVPRITSHFFSVF